MRNIIALLFLVSSLTLVVYSQQPENLPVLQNQTSLAPGTQITVKSTPSENALVVSAKKVSDEQKSLSDINQKKITEVQTNQKDIKTQLDVVEKQLMAKLNADKKYKPILNQINDLQKQLSNIEQATQTKYSKDFSPIQQDISREIILVNGLIPIVKQENNLPDNVTFDISTQQWKVTATKK